MKATVLFGATLVLAMNAAHAGEFVETPMSSSESMSSTDIEMLAERWGITEQAYRRYRELIQGPLSRWNENIDPLIVLGIHAESRAEQRRYAELLAKQEYELVTRTLEFERAYRSAFRRLYPDARVVDPDLLAPYYAKRNRLSMSPAPAAGADANRLRQGDRIIYFVPKGDCGECRSNVERLVELVKRRDDTMVDIYLLGSDSPAEVNRWANKHEIDIDLNRITLNVDAGLYRRILGAGNEEGGRLFLSRGDQIYRIDEPGL